MADWARGVSEDLAAEARYTPHPTQPGEWVCRTCRAAFPNGSAGSRVTDRETHDAWHNA